MHMTAEGLLERAKSLHKSGQLKEAEALYQKLLSINPHHPHILYYLGNVYLEWGLNGLAAQMFSDVVALDPELDAAWCNLGLAYKRENFFEQADAAMIEAEKLNPGAVEYPCNRSAIYVNNGTPQQMLEHAERALTIEPMHIQSRWHKGLALLEMQDWTGFEWAEARLHPDSGCNVEKRMYAGKETPWWQGEEEGLLVVHGEQGLGDEIMFLSCLPDLIRNYPRLKIVVEPNPRIAKLVGDSFPSVTVMGTNRADGGDWPENFPYRPEDVDFKVALGSLPKFFRKKSEDFPGTPYIKADPMLRQRWAETTDKIAGGKKKVAIAWIGGAKTTRIDLRSLNLKNLLPILKQDACFFSLQYTDGAEAEIDELHREHGIMVHHWPSAAGRGVALDNMAALVSNMDLVISVCQTAIHLAGALGVTTDVLTPSRPAWRYGITGNMPWYGSVDLIRQKGDDWGPVIAKAAGHV